MIERSLSAFSVAFFGVALTLFLAVFTPTPIVCGLQPGVDLPWSRTAAVLRGSETDLDIFVRRVELITFRGDRFEAWKRGCTI